MDKINLAPWIERLKKADKKDHEAIVAELAKENALKPADALQLLKLAGWEPAEKTPPNQQGGQEGKKTSVVLRHKTEFANYRRAGLLLTQKAETYEVTDVQLAKLEKDYWVEIIDGKKDGDK